MLSVLDNGRSIVKKLPRALGPGFKIVMQNSTLTFAAALLGLAVLPLTACNKATASEDGHTSQQQLYQLCEQCHGADGLGREAIGAPAIAGLPAWYVDAQLYKFDQGLRGTHPKDITGMRMRPMALALSGPEDMKAVAEYVSHLPKKKTKPTVTGGDAERGRALFAPCVACHGPSGKGNETTKAPPLAGLQDWYLLTQLEHFKSGVRARDPRDETGAQMKPFADALDEQGMKDVVAYIATLPWYR